MNATPTDPEEYAKFVQRWTDELGDEFPPDVSEIAELSAMEEQIDYWREHRVR